jgi:hypothetical protein
MEQKVKGVKRRGATALEVREAPGMLIILGLGAFVPGLFMMFANDGDPSERWIFRLIAVPFLIAGAGILLFRSAWIFDRAANRITNWWGVLAPMKSRVHEGLSDFTRVGITMIRKKSGRTETWEYPVWIETGGNMNRKISLFSEQGESRSLGKAQAIADFLQIPLEDHIAEADDPLSKYAI